MTGIHSSQSDFVNSLLDTTQYYKEIEKNLGATINQITNGSFKMMQFMFPSLAEQEQIGSFFKEMDKLIGLEMKELAKLRQLKKGFLEGMFV